MGSNSNDTFTQQILELRAKWVISFDKDGKFFEYIFGKSNMYLRSMTADVRTKAGLGYPHEAFYTNSSESINAQMRRWMHSRELSLTSFIIKLNDLVLSQEAEANKAYAGISSLYDVRFTELYCPGLLHKTREQN